MTWPPHCKRYERLRRDRTAGVQRGSRRNANPVPSHGIQGLAAKTVPPDTLWPEPRMTFIDTTPWKQSSQVASEETSDRQVEDGPGGNPNVAQVTTFPDVQEGQRGSAPDRRAARPTQCRPATSQTDSGLREAP